jgi:hypothetical protein
MPCLRSPRELVAATTALVTRDAADPRYRTLLTGALLAANWLHGFSDRAPVSGRELPQPSFVQATREYADAALVAAGYGGLPEVGACDATRLVGRGAEAYLLWYCFPETLTPALLDADASRAEVFALIGEVGRGPGGLYGPGVSAAPLPPLAGAQVTVDARGRLVTG